MVIHHLLFVGIASLGWYETAIHYDRPQRFVKRPCGMPPVSYNTINAIRGQMSATEQFAWWSLTGPAPRSTMGRRCLPLCISRRGHPPDTRRPTPRWVWKARHRTLTSPSGRASGGVHGKPAQDADIGHTAPLRRFWKRTEARSVLLDGVVETVAAARSGYTVDRPQAIHKDDAVRRPVRRKVGISA